MEIQSSLIYFDPAHIDITVSENCFPKLTFVARKGTVIEGSVKPSLEGVLISATSQEDQKVFRGKTDAFGKYRIGPVDDVEFAIEASFDDYSFTRLNARDFSVVRVPMIEVGCREAGFVKIVGRMGLTRQGLA